MHYVTSLGRCNNGLSGVMHLPSARALRHLDRYCIVLVGTFKYVSPPKCAIHVSCQDVHHDRFSVVQFEGWLARLHLHEYCIHRINSIFGSPCPGEDVDTIFPRNRSFGTFKHEFQLGDACDFVVGGIDVSA